MSPSLSQPKHKLQVPRPKKGRVRLLVGTRKGAFVVGSDAAREEFDVLAAQGLGVIVHHVVADTRAPKKVLMTALDPEHGAHVRFSEDGGRTFQLSRKSPAFAEAASGLQQRRGLVDRSLQTGGRPGQRRHQELDGDRQQDDRQADVADDPVDRRGQRRRP